MALSALATAADAVRAPWLRLLTKRSTTLRRVFATHELRSLAIVAAGLIGSATLAVLAPMALFWWAPLVLGSVHVLADIRYLALPRYGTVAVQPLDAVVAALLVATVMWPYSLAGPVAVLVAAMLAARSMLKPVVIAAAVALVACFHLAPVPSSYVLLHGHNLVAVGLFAVVFATSRLRRFVVAAIVLLTAALFGGGFDPLLPISECNELASWVLPQSALVAWPQSTVIHIAVSFVMLQSIHYAIWLRAIPEMARKRTGLRSFAESLHALERDVTKPVVWLVAALTVFFVLWGTQSNLEARNWYLRIAGFHAYFELAFLLRWLCKPRMALANQEPEMEQPAKPRGAGLAK